MRRIFVALAFVSSAIAGTWIAGPGKGSHAAGATGNAFTFVKSATMTTSSGTATPTVTAGSNWAAGNLVVCLIKWEGNDTIVSATISGETATVGNTSTHANNDVHSAFVWLTSVSSADSATVVVTMSDVADYSRMIAVEFSATGTHALDAQGAASTGTSTAVASGSYSSSVSTGLAVGGYGEYSGNTLSAPKVGANAATIVQIGGAADTTQFWYYLFSSTQSSVTSNATLSSSAEWTASGACFKSQ